MHKGMPVRVGLIGANPEYGWGSAVHRRLAQLLPDFTLQAVCTTREESAQNAAQIFGAPLWFTNAVEATRHPEIDLIAICVKAPHHYAIARSALEAGKHIYCEWPLAITVEQAEELAALADATEVKAMIGLHLRGSPAMLKAKQLIAEGYVGKIYNITLQARLFGPIMRAMALRSTGTTLLSIYGGHLLDALDHFWGGISDIRMNAAIHLPPCDETGSPIERDAFDHIQFQGRLQNGALFNLDLSGVAATDLGCRWRIDGDQGSLLLTTRDPSIPAMEALSLSGLQKDGLFRDIPVDDRFECPYVPVQPDRYPAYPGSSASREALSSIGNLYGQMADAIHNNTTVSPDFHRAVQIQRLISSLERSDEKIIMSGVPKS